MKKVLVLCTGNSCRSIMAEAMINHYLKDTWHAFSAGTHPSYVHPLALRVLQELHIDTSGLRSKSLKEFLNHDDLDLVITVCDHAKESCPVFLKPVRQLHVGLEDPAPYGDGSEEIALERFRNTIQRIKTEIFPVLVTEDQSLV